jgi:transcriptional regulator with XRE-family HTH domain
MHMFEPLPDLIRMRRKERNLTQEQLARMAGVSRRQLSLLEDGANVSLLFLLKVCKALELTDLQIGALRLRDAPPEVRPLLSAHQAMAWAQAIVSQFTDLSGQLDEAAASIKALLDHAVAVHMAGIEADARATPAPKPRTAAKTTARKRAR